MNENSCYFSSLLDWCCQLFRFLPLNRCVVVSCCFNSKLPNNMILSIFSYAYFICLYPHILFGTVSVQICCPFDNWVFVLLLFGFRSHLHILETSLLSNRCFLNLSESVTDFFDSLKGLFAEQKFLILIKFNFFHGLCL